MNVTPRLLCTDLDRTLLPNGDAEESPRVRDLFARVAGRPELSLAYVTGRRLALVVEAMNAYSLPRPRFAICDVGASIYEHDGADFVALESWQEVLAQDWPRDAAAQLSLQTIDGLSLQEHEHQSRFKVSYYAPVLENPVELLVSVESCIAGSGLSARLVYSVDESTGTGMLDLLPASAGKLAAIGHLIQRPEFAVASTLFAGDSGNDLEVLASEIPAVLVANATVQVREEAVHLASERGQGDRLCLATGSLEGLNGNYAAGILEGLVHFWPETASWLKSSDR